MKCKRYLTMSIAAIVLAGCATAPSGPTTEEQINAKVAQWARTLAANDVDAFMALHADTFSDSDGNDKAALRLLIENMIDQGAFDDLDVFTDNMVMNVDGDTVEVIGIGLNSALGGILVDLTYKKIDGNWMVVSLTAA
jgi:PBP1b-binding outer membrane lipoprotein LpoB